MPNSLLLELGRHDWLGDCVARVGRARACVLVSRRHRTGESPRDLRSLVARQLQSRISLEGTTEADTSP